MEGPTVWAVGSREVPVGGLCPTSPSRSQDTAAGGQCALRVAGEAGTRGRLWAVRLAPKVVLHTLASNPMTPQRSPRAS